MITPTRLQISWRCLTWRTPAVRDRLVPAFAKGAADAIMDHKGTRKALLNGATIHDFASSAVRVQVTGMLDYWERALVWARVNTELLTRGKLFTSLGLAVVNLVMQAGAGLRPWDATWQFTGVTLAAYAVVTAASFAFNAFIRAPVALDAAREMEQIELREQAVKSSGYAQAIGGIENRENELRRIWVPDFFRKTLDSRIWLGHIVPEGKDFRDYIDPLKQWAYRAPNEIIISKKDPTSGDVQFKIRKKWFD